jgi:hypothetical protein
MNFIRNLNFLSLLTVIFMVVSLNAKASQNIYEVENIQINTSAPTPAQARDLAIANAQKNGLVILLNRLNVNSKIIEDSSNDEISDLVRSRQIIDENIAGNNYSAMFNLVFAKDFVDDFLLRKNISANSSKSTSLAISENKAALLIPVKILKTQALLWEVNNEWKGTLERILQDQLNSKLKIPIGDLSDIATVNVEEISNYNYQQFEPLLEKYHCDFVYLAFFDYDSIDNKTIITLKTIRKFKTTEVKLSLVNVDRLDYVNFLSKTAQRTIEYLLNPQNFSANSEISNDQKSTQNILQLTILVSSLDEWLVVKNKIEASNLINQMEIKSILQGKVKISVNYIAKNPNIIDSFAAIGLFGAKESDDSYLLSLKPFKK